MAPCLAHAKFPVTRRCVCPPPVHLLYSVEKFLNSMWTRLLLTGISRNVLLNAIAPLPSCRTVHMDVVVRLTPLGLASPLRPPPVSPQNPGTPRRQQSALKPIPMGSWALLAKLITQLPTPSSTWSSLPLDCYFRGPALRRIPSSLVFLGTSLRRNLVTSQHPSPC